MYPQTSGSTVAVTKRQGVATLGSRNPLPGDSGAGPWIPQLCDSWLGVSPSWVFPMLPGNHFPLCTACGVPKGQTLPLFLFLLYQGGVLGGGVPPSVIPRGGLLADPSCSRNLKRTKLCLALAAIPERQEKSCSTPWAASITLFDVSPLRISLPVLPFDL